MDIRTLYREGHSIKEIARQTGRSLYTVRRVLRDAGPPGFNKLERSSCLDGFKLYLHERLEHRIQSVKLGMFLGVGI